MRKTVWFPLCIFKHTKIYLVLWTSKIGRKCFYGGLEHLWILTIRGHMWSLTSTNTRSSLYLFLKPSFYICSISQFICHCYKNKNLLFGPQWMLGLSGIRRIHRTNLWCKFSQLAFKTLSYRSKLFLNDPWKTNDYILSLLKSATVCQCFMMTAFV